MATTNDNSIMQLRAEITALQALSPGYYHLTVHAPEMAQLARPGQFAQVRVASGIDPLLARPLSIFYAIPESGEVAFLFKVVGRGTALLAQRAVGESLTVLGPYGNGFLVPQTADTLVLVAGGVGMPPLYFLAQTVRRARPNLPITLYYGGRSDADLLELARWQALGTEMVLATDDGSAGRQGLVTAALYERFLRQPVPFLAACGPRPMLRAVQQLALAHNIAGQLSLEACMACGVGACLGCVCGTVQGNRRVCFDGPVFSLDEVTLDG